MKDLQRAKDAELAKGGLNEEEILRIKRAKADALLAPNNGQVLFELSVEGPSSSPSVGTKYNQDDFFCYISTRVDTQPSTSMNKPSQHLPVSRSAEKSHMPTTHTPQFLYEYNN